MKISSLLLMLAIAMSNGGAYAASAAQGDETTHRHVANDPVKQEGVGILKGVNTAEGKVRIAHEAIPSLHWPAMTMWFSLRGPLPKGVEVDDSVHFELDQNRSNEWVVTRIEHKR